VGLGWMGYKRLTGGIHYDMWMSYRPRRLRDSRCLLVTVSKGVLLLAERCPKGGLLVGMPRRSL